MDTHRPRPRARKRDSDAVLRASVLDAAIELGIGNKTVAKWMFSPLEEGDEEEEPQQPPQRPVTPPRPYTATTASDEHYQNQSRPQDQAADEGPKHTVHFSTSSNSTHSNHGPPPTSPRKGAHNKLRKAKPDGYESDGYVSDATRRKSKKKSKKKDKDGAATNDEESDGGYLSEASAKRKLSFFGRKKTKKSKDEERFAVPVPPVPHLTIQYPMADRFGGRTSPNTFVSSNRSSWTDLVTSRNVTPVPPSASLLSQFREDTIQALTHAFKEDAQSITESVDWSNTYSHFPRVVRSPQPPLPGSTQERPGSQSDPQPSFDLATPHIRPLKPKPSPLSLSPFSSGYRHASEHSPVPSEMVMISSDPASSTLSTGAARDKLLIAANTTPAAFLPTSSPSPSPIEPPPSFDFVVPIPSPGGSMRSRQFEIPPPSPAPQGPLPKVPPILLPNDPFQNSPLPNRPSTLLPSRFTVGGLSPGLPPARTPSPVIRGKEQPFPVNPVIRVQENVDVDRGEPYYPQKLNNPGWSVPRQPPPFPPPPVPTVVSPRKSIGASSYASSNIESEIEAIEALYRDRDDRPDEISNHAKVDSVISTFGGQQTARESGYYDKHPRRSNDGELENHRLSKPIRIPLDEDDYISPTGGYLDMDSDDEDDYVVPKEDGRHSMWGRQSLMDETRSGETRNRFVRNVEAMYKKDGRDRPTINGRAPPVSALSPRKPAAYI